ncbi:unnamed protein product, partial [Ascophyllum nodosum]
SGKPLLTECLVPEDIRTSTYRLPSMDKNFDEFLELDDNSEALLAEQLDWTPPGCTSPPMMQLRALPNHGKDNCLFHAVSMALWGVNDRNHILRKLACMVLEHHHDVLRGIFARGMHKMAAKGFFRQPNEKQVEDEWDIIRQSAQTPGIRTDWFFLY